MPPMNDPSIPFSSSIPVINIPSSSVSTGSSSLTLPTMAPSFTAPVMAPSAPIGTLDFVTPETTKMYSDAIRIIGIENVAKLPTISGPILLQLAQLNDVNRQLFFQTIGSTHLNVCSEPSTSSSTQFCGGGIGVGGSMMATSTCSSMNMNTSTSVSSLSRMASTSMTRKPSTNVGQQQNVNHLVTNFMSAGDGSPNVFNLEFLQQQGSPNTGTPYRLAKNEPSSSSNSQPGTPLQSDRRSVPACAICATDSTGIHFGVDACAACSAFFRRTVVLNKTYACNKGGNCIIAKDGSIGQKCRACRFKKCLTVGMDRNSVQHRRDAIGKYAAGVKREHSPDLETEQPPALRPAVQPPVPEPFVLPTLPVDSPAPPPPTSNNGFMKAEQTASSSCNSLPSYPHHSSILRTLIDRQFFVLEQRQLFYADRLINEWFRTPETSQSKGVRELEDFGSCMFDLWKVEPRIAADFMRRNKYLARLSEEENIKIFRNFVIVRQAVEEPYLTWKHGGLENDWFVLPNRTYIDFSDPRKYFTTGVLDEFALDIKTAEKIFVPSFQAAMQSVSHLMKYHDIKETELAILLGLVLLDPAILELKDATREYLKNLRDQLIQDAFIYFEDEYLDPEIRIADLYMILGAIKIHAMKTAENMHILRFFDLIPMDVCFAQMLVEGAENAKPPPRKCGAFYRVGRSGRLFRSIPPSPKKLQVSRSTSPLDFLNNSPKVPIVVVSRADSAPTDLATTDSVTTNSAPTDSAPTDNQENSDNSDTSEINVHD